MSGGESSLAPSGIKDPRTIARKYQLELCKKAVEENIIVYLGTGCGKTHIAVLLMYELGHLIRKPSKRVCIFLAPTIPLVRQQAVVIENSTDFKVHCYYGNQKNLKDHNAWNQEINKAEVLVMTPQILLHSLHHCFIKMDLVALLIFDECHHAQKDKRHAYAQIMKEFYDTSMKSPRIFGMTASPIIGKGATNQAFSSKCVNSLEKLLAAKVYSVDDKAELECFSASPDVKVYYYDPVFRMASSLIVAHSDKLEEIKLQCISMIKDMFSDVRERQKKIKILSRLHDDINFCLNQIGLVGALKATHGLLASDVTDLSELERVKINGDSCHIQHYLSKAMAVLRSNLLADNHDADSLHFETIEDPFYSKKLMVLIKILSSYRSLGAQKVERKTQLARRTTREGCRRARCVRRTKELRKSTTVDEKNVCDGRGTKSRGGSLLEEKAGNWVRMSPISVGRNHPSNQNFGSESEDEEMLEKQLEAPSTVVGGASTLIRLRAPSMFGLVKLAVGKRIKFYPLIPLEAPSTPLKAPSTLEIEFSGVI